MSIGFHVSKMKKTKTCPGTMAHSIASQVAEIGKCGVDIGAVQIFVMGPRGYTINITDEDAAEIKALSDSGLKIIVHGSYLNHPFGDKSVQALHFIRQELEVSNKIGAYGFVIHLPRKPVERIAEVYPAIAAMRGAVKIFLEIESMKATEDTYETAVKLQKLYSKLLPIDGEVGLCVDSAHKWSSGFNNKEYVDVKRWTDAVDAIGIKNIAFHLNDSNRAFASGVDNHHRLTQGNIWRDFSPVGGIRNPRESGLQAYLEWIVRRDAVTILERDYDGLAADCATLTHMGFFAK